LEAGDVGVVADEPLALAGDRVDRPGGLGLLGQLVDERHDPLLVGDRDVRPQEVVAADLGDRVGQDDRGAIPELVGRVDPLVVERSLLHRPRQGVGDRMADEYDALGHDATLPRSSKKPGYEIAALAGRSTVVRSAATRPAMAKVIARRWSSRLSTSAPASGRPPRIRRSSPSTSTSAPRARRPSAVPAIRSDSLWRSSPAPRIVVLPVAEAAA